MERDGCGYLERHVHRAQGALKRSIAALLLLCALPQALRAQTQCVATNTPCSTGVGALQVIIDIPAIFELTLSSTTTDLATPTTAIYNQGFAETTGPVATIRSNAPWALSISALSPTWGAVSTDTEPARPDKAASDLSWATSPGGAFTDLSTSAVQIASGLPTLGSSVSLFYRTRYLWAVDTPGNYSLQVIFTIAAP